MTVGVVGLGLIGGSIGLSLRDPSRRLVGYDPNETHAQTALERGCVDQLGSLEEVAQADVVFVAAPPANVVEVLKALRTYTPPRTILTDCASVKRAVADWGIAAKDAWFVPGHPMAGHEKSGPGFASAWMFRGARWILSPLPVTSPVAVQKVESLVRGMGALPIRVPAAKHDRHVAVVSHLPHAIAGILLQFAEELDEKDVAGGSWRDLTRVGGVDPGLWTQIFLANRVELEKVLQEMSKRLSELAVDVQANDEAAVRSFFELGQSAKSRQTALGSREEDTPKPKNAKGRKRP